MNFYNRLYNIFNKRRISRVLILLLLVSGFFGNSKVVTADSPYADMPEIPDRWRWEISFIDRQIGDDLYAKNPAIYSYEVSDRRDYQLVFDIENISDKEIKRQISLRIRLYDGEGYNLMSVYGYVSGPLAVGGKRTVICGTDADISDIKSIKIDVWEGETDDMSATAVPVTTDIPKPSQDLYTQTPTPSDAISTNKPTSTATPTPPKKGKSSQRSVPMRAPKITVKRKAYDKKINIAQVRLISYVGTHARLYYRKGGKKFKRVKLRSERINKKKPVFRIGYKKKIKKLYIRVRTYKVKNKKKKYSRYSKIKKV